jgi:hypothetical protein
MATIKLADLIVANPCNQAMEDRNWDGIRQVLQYLDQIINIENINNQIQFNLVNIYNITVNNDIYVTNNVVVENNVTVENNVYVTNDITSTTVNVTNMSVTNIEVYNLTAIYYITGDGTYLCPPECGSPGPGGGGSGCAGLPSTLYATWSFCANSGSIALTEVSNTCTASGVRTWEGSGTVADGTLKVRLFCLDGYLFYAIDACTGLYPDAAALDNCDTGSLSGVGLASLPQTINTGAPPSSCDASCFEGLSLTFTT